jgi:anti-anti-sigma factor
MRVLIAIKRRIEQKGGKLKLCRTSKMVDKIMSALELMSVFEVYEDVESAIKAG